MPSIDPDRLSKAMAQAGFSTKQLAERCGISVQYAHDLTTGHRRLKRNPGLRKKIAGVLGVPMDWIEAVEPRREAS